MLICIWKQGEASNIENTGQDPGYWNDKLN